MLSRTTQYLLGWLHGRLAVLLLTTLGLLRTSAGTERSVDVLMWHNDLARTGQNLYETKLTLSNVNSNTFGQLFNYPVDGYVYAQPLYLSGVAVSGKGVRNLVFVATEHDSVYAFDADDGRRDGGNPLWQVSISHPELGVSSVPIADLNLSEPPELGITGTPVIDPESGTLYVVMHTKEVAPGNITYPQRLHALDVATGAEKFGGPVLIHATVPGSGINVNPSGQVVFDEQFEFQRPGLLLLNGVVYVAFAAAGDVGPYHGWILGFDAHSLALTQIYNDTPNGYQGGIWMSGAAPSADDQGRLYCMTGNGDFAPALSDFGDSVLKLNPSQTNLVVEDYFTPFNQAVLDAGDGDLGSGGPMLLPDSAGSALHPHLLVGCGKAGTIYLLDRDNLGHFNPTNDSQIVQSLPGLSGVWGNPAWFNGWLYYQASSEALKAYSVTNGHLSPTPISQNSASVWNYPGGTPSVSASGATNGIVWLLQTDNFFNYLPAVLHAYNATNLEDELYNSEQVSARDEPGPAQKFSIPVVANGKVYVPGASELSVYGLLEAPTITIHPLSQSVSPGTELTLSVAAEGTPSLAFQWQFNGESLSGQTNATLILDQAAPSQSGVYSVVVSNAYGTAVSTNANVVVVSPPALAIDLDQQLVLTGTGGVTYEIQKLDLAEMNPAWTRLMVLDLAGEVTVSALVQETFRDPSEPQSGRLYRVQVLPSRSSE